MKEYLKEFASIYSNNMVDIWNVEGPVETKVVCEIIYALSVTGMIIFGYAITIPRAIVNVISSEIQNRKNPG